MSRLGRLAFSISVFSLFWIGLAFVMPPAAHAQATTTVLFTSPGDAFFNWGGLSSNEFAWQYNATSTTQSLCSVKVKVYSLGSPATSTITLDIRRGTGLGGDDPTTGSLIGQFYAAIGDIDAVTGGSVAVFYPYNLETCILLENSSTYWFKISHNYSNSTNFFRGVQQLSGSFRSFQFDDIKTWTYNKTTLTWTVSTTGFIALQLVGEPNIVFSDYDLITATSTDSFLTCDTGDTAFFTNSLCNLARFLLVPSQASVNNFNKLIDLIKRKPPLGYFEQISLEFEKIGSSTPAYSFTADIQVISAPFFDPIKDILAIVVYIFGGLWLFNRIRHFDDI